MKRIIKPRIVTLNADRETEERDFAVVFYLLEDQKMFQYVLRFEDVIQALDGEGRLYSKEGRGVEIGELCNPGGHTDFGWMVSLVLNAAVYFGRITKETYFDLVRRHFELYYLVKYEAKTKMCRDFYARYFSKRIKRNVRDYEQLFERLNDTIEEKGRRTAVQRGGRFVGCYYDRADRIRPRTERKYWESIVTVSEKMWICFVECFNRPDILEC